MSGKAISRVGGLMLDELTDPCKLLVKNPVPDGLGGFKYVWQDGPEFHALVRKDNSAEDRVAEKEGANATYTIVVGENFPLEYYDVIRHMTTGETLRITTPPAGNRIPANSLIGTSGTRYRAERWEIPE